MLPRPDQAKSGLSLDIRELDMKQFLNDDDDEMREGIGEQIDHCVSETIMLDEIGGEPALAAGIALTHIPPRWRNSSRRCRDSTI
jgi:hypothetical protein